MPCCLPPYTHTQSKEGRERKDKSKEKNDYKQQQKIVYTFRMFTIFQALF